MEDLPAEKKRIVSLVMGSLVYASNKYLLSSYYVPGTVLDAKQSLIDNADRDPDAVSLLILMKLGISEQIQRHMDTTRGSKYINK